VRAQLDQSFGRQNLEGFAKRRTGYAEALAQHFFGQCGARGSSPFRIISRSFATNWACRESRCQGLPLDGIADSFSRARFEARTGAVARCCFGHVDSCSKRFCLIFIRSYQKVATLAFIMSIYLPIL